MSLCLVLIFNYFLEHIFFLGIGGINAKEVLDISDACDLLAATLR